MSKRSARWHVYKHDPAFQIVWIVDDFSTGPDVCLSVTNDAEDVVRIVNERYPGHRIIYRDTMGRWDELSHVNGTFTGFIAGQATAPDLY